MTPDELKQARQSLGLSARALGEMLGYTGDPERSIQRLESGERRIIGPVAMAVRALVRWGPEPW